MRSGRTRSRNPCGFTLLEVLVALTILGLAVVTAIQLFAGGLRLLRVSGSHQEAVLIADQKLREIEVVEPGRTTGTERDYEWELNVTPTEVPLELTVTGPRPLRLYRLEVSVRWEGSRSIQLATLRTAVEPDPGQPRP